MNMSHQVAPNSMNTSAGHEGTTLFSQQKLDKDPLYQQTVSGTTAVGTAHSEKKNTEYLQPNDYSTSAN
jgi:hypothetical protein